MPSSVLDGVTCPVSSPAALQKQRRWLEQRMFRAGVGLLSSGKALCWPDLEQEVGYLVKSAYQDQALLLTLVGRAKGRK